MWGGLLGILEITELLGVGWSTGNFGNYCTSGCGVGYWEFWKLLNFWVWGGLLGILEITELMGVGWATENFGKYTEDKLNSTPIFFMLLIPCTFL